MPDITAGNERYLIFSKGVSDETIVKINETIKNIATKTILNNVKTMSRISQNRQVWILKKLKGHIPSDLLTIALYFLL
jgi:hypothetical protein